MPGDAARAGRLRWCSCIAGVSDWLDGFAARKLKAGSDFGRMLDPIADKVLVAVALMMLVAEGNFAQFNPTTGALSLLRLVPALIILAREILVSGLREFLAGTRVSVPVTAIAKIKTAVQMVAIGAMILTPLADEYRARHPGADLCRHRLYPAVVAAALTVYTGVIYFRNGMAHIRPGPTPDCTAARQADQAVTVTPRTSSA